MKANVRINNHIKSVTAAWKNTLTSGTAAHNGAKNMDTRNPSDATIADRPVRPPACTPAPDSTNTTTGEEPSAPAQKVAKAHPTKPHSAPGTRAARADKGGSEGERWASFARPCMTPEMSHTAATNRPKRGSMCVRVSPSSPMTFAKGERY